MAYAFNDDKSKFDFKKTWNTLTVVPHGTQINSQSKVKYCVDPSGEVTLIGCIIFNGVTALTDYFPIPSELQPKSSADGGINGRRDFGLFRTIYGNVCNIYIEHNNFYISFETAPSYDDDEITFEMSYNPTV